MTKINIALIFYTSSVYYGIKKIINRIWEVGSDTWHELHQQYKHNDTTPQPHTQDDHDPCVEESYNLIRIHGSFYLGISAKQTIAIPIIPNSKGWTPCALIIKRQIATLKIRTPLSKGLFINKL